MVLTLVMGMGMARLSTEADLLDILPEGDPHTEAAQNASREFRGFYDFITVFYKIDEDKCAKVSAERLPFRLSTANCGNITDEAYVRGMEEVSQFAKARVPSAQYAIDLAAIVKTVNWTNSAYANPQAGFLGPLLGGQPGEAGQPVNGTFSMPGTDPQGEALYEAAWRGANAADDSVKDVVAPTWQAGRTLIFFDPGAHGLDRVDLGREFYAMVDEYAAEVAACDDGSEQTACTLQWNVFSHEGLAVRGVSALDAHASDVTQRDVAKLAPILAAALIVIMVLSFRDARVILVSAVNLVIAFLWTAGLMGWLGIPFTGLNLTIIPIILGVGIDYGIQMVSEYLDHKAQGMTDTEAFRRAGGLAGMAMFVATITTVGGLLLMLLSPSVLMAQLAIVTSIALTVCFLFALTMIPAMLVLSARASARTRPEPGSPAILALCAWLGRNRVATGILVVALCAASAVSATNLKTEAFGNPELNYPPGDRVRDDSATINDLFFGGTSDTASNYLIVEGDFTQPAAHRFLDRLTENLEQHPDVQGFSTASATRIVRAWLAIDQGTPDAVVSQLILGNAPPWPAGTPLPPAQDLQYPQTQEEIERVFDDIFASPFANFMTILLNPRDADGSGYNMGMVPYDTRQGLSYEESQRVWFATEEVIAQTHSEVPDSGLQVHQFGNNAVSHLFISQELPWVNRVGIASFALVAGLIAVTTRSWRATLAISTVMLASSLWWFGLLPPMGIGLSVGLMLPLVFISAIGSDNALHLIWNLENLPDARRVYRFVGKAVTVAIATDAIAFVVFAFQTDLLVRKTMLATVASVTTLWLATLLIVPLFYPPGAAKLVRGTQRK
ncbi:MAG: MMPL family transporter [Candidatus Thermoplasmatota archaeon]